MEVVSHCRSPQGRKQAEECRYSWHSSRGETGAKKKSQRKLDEKQQHEKTWDWTGRDPRN